MRERALKHEVSNLREFNGAVVTKKEEFAEFLYGQLIR